MPKKPKADAKAKEAAPSKPTTSKTKICAESRCKAPATSDGYCRLHYLRNWKELRSEKKDKAEKRLNSYVDRLMKKYPGEYLDKIKESLESEEKFKEAMQEVDLEVEGDGESDREYLEKLSRNVKTGE
jgi:hypothetical protein